MTRKIFIMDYKNTHNEDYMCVRKNNNLTIT